MKADDHEAGTTQERLLARGWVTWDVGRTYLLPSPVELLVRPRVDAPHEVTSPPHTEAPFLPGPRLARLALDDVRPHCASGVLPTHSLCHREGTAAVGTGLLLRHGR